LELRDKTDAVTEASVTADLQTENPETPEIITKTPVFSETDPEKNDVVNVPKPTGKPAIAFSNADQQTIVLACKHQAYALTVAKYRILFKYRKEDDTASLPSSCPWWNLIPLSMTVSSLTSSCTWWRK